jgi:hypothetical protein
MVTTIGGEDYKTRIVISKFPSEDHGQTWFADPDYARAKLWFGGMYLLLKESLQDLFLKIAMAGVFRSSAVSSLS